MKKRLLSMLMAVLMIASLVPATALAAGSTTHNEHATHDVLTVNIEKDTAKKQPGIVFEYCNTCGTADKAELKDGIVTALVVTPFAAQKDICAAGHHTPITKVLQAETCEKPKITVTYCSVCGSAVTPLGSTSALQITRSENGGHTYSKFFVTKAPTCTEPGYGYTKCDKCGEALFVYGETQIENLMTMNQKTAPKTSAVKANEKLFAATNPGHKNNDNIVTTDVDVKDYRLGDRIGQNEAYTIEEYTKYYAEVKATHAETVSGMLVPNAQGGMDNVDIYAQDDSKWENWAFLDAKGHPITGEGVVGSKYCKDCGVVVNAEDEPGSRVDSLNEQHAAFMTLKQGYLPYLDSQGHKIPGVTDTWYCSECEKTWGGTEIPYASYWGNETSKMPAGCVDDRGLPTDEITEMYYVDGDLFTAGKRAATCTDLGYTGDVYKLIDGVWVINAKGTNTPVLGHNMKAIESRAATCYSEGWTVSNYSVCTRCGATEGTSVVKAAQVPHSMVAVDVIAPTCKSAGMTVLECSFCHKLAAATTSGDAAYLDGNGNYVTINEFADHFGIPLNQLWSLVFVKNVKAVPHAAAAELKDAKEATCTEVGYTGDKVCKWCGIVMEKGKEIPMKEHTVVDVAAVEATCTTDGMTAGTKCSVCGTVLSGCEVVKALGHDYKDGKCTRCGEKDPNYVAPEFKDAASIRDYAKDAVAWAAKEGIVKGDDNGNFLPTADITRQDFVTMLWRLKGSVASEKALTFGDKADIKDYAQTAVAWAVENGYINGRDNGNFDPAAKITRAEIVAILNRIAENAKAEKAADFTDIATHWAKDAIAWAAEAGIVNGVGNNMFAPNDNASRQDTVVMLYKFVNLK